MVSVFRFNSCQRIQNFISFAEESYGIISSGMYVTLAQNCIVEALKRSRINHSLAMQWLTLTMSRFSIHEKTDACIRFDFCMSIVIQQTMSRYFYVVVKCDEWIEIQYNSI